MEDIEYKGYTIKLEFNEPRKSYGYIIYKDGKPARGNSGMKTSEDAVSKAKEFIDTRLLKEDDIKPTFNRPITPMAKNFDKKFNSTMDSQGINLNEVDKLLTEREFSLKKKIFSLAKMEALVFNDPKLTMIYDDMAQNGEEKYGYHYNETIMNIIFNDYILNSAKFLQKYKMAVPKKKKRRDKSGINALKKNVETTLAKAKTKKKKMGEGTMKDIWNDFLDAPIIDGDDEMDDPDYMGMELGDYEPTKFEKKVTDVTNKIGSTIGNTVRKVGNVVKKAIPEVESIDETTTAGSAGGDAGYVGYAGPAAWSSKGDLIKGSKSSGSKNVGGGSSAGVMRKPMWPGGSIVGENYLTESSFFEKKLQQINEINLNLNAALREKYCKPAANKLMDDMRFVTEETRAEVNNKEINDTSAFTSNTIKNWNNADSKLEDETLETGKMDSTNLKEEATNQSMISDNPTSMTNDTTQNMANTIDNPEKAISGIERGTAAGAGEMSENELFENIERELNAFSKHQNNLSKMMEERKTNSQIINDRVTAQNPKNFKSDMKNSGTEDTIKLDNFLQTKDDITEVGDNAHKFSEDIEKEVLSKTKGEALKNVGNSGNEKGNEIPKRNMTTEEQHEVDLYREGLGDYIYENPSEQFEKRMETDMGERDYKLRQDRLKARENREMYHKVSVPVTNKKETEPKYEENLKESLITGRYKDSLGKSHIIDFKFKEVFLSESVDESWSQIHFDGMGNSYANKLNQDSAKLEINEAIVRILDCKKYYINDKKQLFAVENKKAMLSEADEKKLIQESDEVKKMKKLLGYKTNTYVDNRFNKRF